jgi:cell filamentation protein
VVAALNEESDYQKVRNYWKYLKAKLKKENKQLGSATTHLEIFAPDGEKRLADLLARLLLQKQKSNRVKPELAVLSH